MAQGNSSAANGSNTSGLQRSHTDHEPKTDPIMFLHWKEKTSSWNNSTAWSSWLYIYKKIHVDRKQVCTKCVHLYGNVCESSNKNLLPWLSAIDKVPLEEDA